MSKPNEKIGLYGGSFDPIHNGHLILARDAMERLELDKVIFLPARISPHKLDRPPAPPEARCLMLATAIADEPRFEMDACEIEREGPSFTIDTVRAFSRHATPARSSTISSVTTICRNSTPGRTLQISARRRSFVVLSRAGMPFLSEFPIITRHIEISSTEIRNRVARGLSVRYMVPLPACDVIAKLGLYRDD